MESAGQGAYLGWTPMERTLIGSSAGTGMCVLAAEHRCHADTGAIIA